MYAYVNVYVGICVLTQPHLINALCRFMSNEKLEFY
jgi:hypothetical protein